MTSINRIIP